MNGGGTGRDCETEHGLLPLAQAQGRPRVNGSDDESRSDQRRRAQPKRRIGHLAHGAAGPGCHDLGHKD